MKIVKWFDSEQVVYESGVETVRDVIETMMAGATLVGVGTATYTKGMAVYETLKKEIGTNHPSHDH